MKESVKEFCRINGIGGVTADALFDAYIGSDANDNSRDKAQLDDTGNKKQAAIPARAERTV